MSNLYDFAELTGKYKKICDNTDGYFSGETTGYVFADGIAVFPGFCDVHVHFREPGFSYKETIKTGSMAAAAGGYTSVCSMPNLNPVPDGLESLRVQTEIIERDSVIDVRPYGAITKGEKGKILADIDELAPYVCAFSDDGKGVQNEEILLSAMKKCAELGKIVALHEEDESLLLGGVINDGERAKELGIKGICSMSEYLPLQRDIFLAKEAKAKIHICHVSTKESVDIIRKAKLDGVDVTCETAPHYLILADAEVKNEGRFKMNPPLRGEADRAALIEGLLDGTIDMIATDHAPHGAKEKNGDLNSAPFGITGLETAFALLYTFLVKGGVISLKKLLELICYNPRKRFGLQLRKDDFTVFDLNTEYAIDSQKFVSKGKSTPFDGRKVFGKCLATVYGGKTVWQESLIRN